MFVFLFREVLLWGDLPWPGPVPGGLVYQSGGSGPGYSFLPSTVLMQQKMLHFKQFISPGHYCNLTPDSLFFFLGTDKYGFGFGGTGKKSNNKQFDSYGEVTDNERSYYLHV